ncbi:MAG: ArgE/DapE family deacylase [Chloroflexi bacterium]|nr:ArgE/DapE family deacylase [Chloroflexota bacterium]
MDQAETIDLLTRLVAIDSVNPALVPGGKGEAEIAAFAADYLRRAGLEVHLQEAAPGRPNVIAILRGTGGGSSLMFNGHLDTVGVQGMADPFTARVEDGKLFGRGAYDMKGPDAAAMLAVCALRSSGVTLAGDVILALVADEEHASLGTSALVREWRADAAIVVEPTEMHLVLAHKGFVWARVTTVGRAAHGSRFDEGLDAIVMAGKYLAEFDSLERELRARSPHPLLGPPSIHASMIRGGQELSSYPAECAIEIERRTVPGETMGQVEAELRAVADRVSAVDSRFRANAEAYFTRSAFEIDPNAPIARTTHRVAARHLAREPERRGATFWMDSAILSEAGIPTAIFGPGGAGAHSTNEYVLVDDVVKCAEIYADLAVEFCQRMGNE